MNKSWENQSGCYDPTANEAIDNSGYEQMMGVLKQIWDICDKAGYHVENRIILKEKKTGKVWK